MGLRQLHTAETMFIDDGLTDGAVFPPSSNAVYDALQNAIELPSVTAEDDGDVLTVVSGAWAKATPSGGGGGVLIVNATVSNDETTITMDKTYREIATALQSGGAVLKFPANYEDYSERITNIVYCSIYSYVDDEEGEITSMTVQDSMGDTFTTNSDSGYPSMSVGNL